MALNNADRQRAFMEKKKTAGMVKLTEWVYPEYKTQARAYIKDLNESTIRSPEEGEDEDIEFI